MESLLDKIRSKKFNFIKMHPAMNLNQEVIRLVDIEEIFSNQVEPLVMQKIADIVKDIMQEGFEIAMGGSMDLSEEANRKEQTARYDRAVKNYTEIILSNFTA